MNAASDYRSSEVLLMFLACAVDKCVDLWNSNILVKNNAFRKDDVDERMNRAIGSKSTAYQSICGLCIKL